MRHNPLEEDFRQAVFLIFQGSSEGISRLRKLSAAGFSPASYELGNCFYIGNLVEKSSSKAVDKWREASNGGRLLACINALKYEIYYAKMPKKTFYYVLYILTALKSLWLTLRGANDIRVLGNTRSDMKL